MILCLVLILLCDTVSSCFTCKLEAEGLVLSKWLTFSARAWLENAVSHFSAAAWVLLLSVFSLYISLLFILSNESV